MENCWEQYSVSLGQMANLLVLEWKCTPADPMSVCATKMEQQCDDWCNRLAEDLSNPPPAAAELRPWILSRLKFAAKCAKRLARESVECPLHWTAVAKVLLIQEWHIHHSPGGRGFGAGRDAFKQSGNSQSEQ